jgi:hypothetical protein
MGPVALSSAAGLYIAGQILAKLLHFQLVMSKGVQEIIAYAARTKCACELKDLL